MKVILQGRFDPLLKSEKKIVTGYLLNPFPTELSQCLSCGDSIAGNECLEVHKQQCSTIKNCDKKKVFSAAIPKNKVYLLLCMLTSIITKKRIIKPKNFSSEFSSPKELGKKSASSMKTNSSVLQCKIDKSVVSKYSCILLSMRSLLLKMVKNPYWIYPVMLIGPKMKMLLMLFVAYHWCLLKSHVMALLILP
jgi:hypothetical protein